jgi:hypothetical protein
VVLAGEDDAFAVASETDVELHFPRAFGTADGLVAFNPHRLLQLELL